MEARQGLQARWMMRMRQMRTMALTMTIRRWIRRSLARREAKSRPTSTPLDRALHAAERANARGRLGNGARQLLTSAAQAEGEITTLNRIGDLLARADQIELGIAYFERVARAYADDGFWEKAIAIYQKILRYDPERADVRARLASLYQQSGLPTRA